ncbi:hypothetical protein OEG92_00950 [Polaribacter sejongensis]|uniref:murein hydrolase activator EnvC family protein n=1 Tax=Polaribacter sejongensis TaxID=985043 RepID=UPI0035A57BB8
MLFKEKKKVDNALEDLNDLNRKISVRAKLIAIINAEARILSKEIRANETELKKLKKKLADLKADYADIILKSYKSKSQQSRMMFLLSSQNFHQAYKRFEYMKQYTAYRKKQGEEIVIHANEVLAVNDSLLVQKSLKDKLIASENEQKKEIEEDKRNQEKLLAAIKKKESSYKKELQSKVKEEKRVTVQIDRKIREEIERANRIARAKLKDKPSNSKPTVVKKNEFILSPEAKALAAKFELNKGKLPWPRK